MQKRFGRLSQFTMVLVGACSFITIMQIVFNLALNSDFRNSLFIFPTPTPVPIEESLTLMPNSHYILTNNHYEGVVTITVRGEARLDSETLFDAFYTYSSNEENTARFTGLRIDNQETLFPIFSGVPPRYNSDHEYRFLYYVGDIPKQISFQLVSDGHETSSGEFVLEISSQDKVSPSGR